MEPGRLNQGKYTTGTEKTRFADTTIPGTYCTNTAHKNEVKQMNGEILPVV